MPEKETTCSLQDEPERDFLDDHAYLFVHLRNAFASLVHCAENRVMPHAVLRTSSAINIHVETGSILFALSGQLTFFSFIKMHKFHAQT